MRTNYRPWGAMILTLCLIAGTGHCELTRLIAPIALKGPVLDGDLAEPFWQKAGVTSRFIVAGTGLAAEPGTVAKVATTSRALYFGFICLEGLDGEELTIELDPMVAYEAEKPPGPSDVQKPDLQRRGTRRVRVTARLKEESTVSGAGPNASARAKALAGGMTVEVCIPFAELVPDALRPRRGDLWAANVARGPERNTSVWILPAEDGTPPGELVFGRSNLIDNGDAEEWEKDSPKGWTITNFIDEKETPAMAFRETDIVVGGSRAVRVMYRNRLTVKPCGRIPLRKGAMYCLGALLLFGPATGTKASPVLSAAPSKTRSFEPPTEVVRVRMPFLAEADHVEPVLTVAGPRGILIIDDFRLEMERP